jgi:hypothetical protein
MTNRTVPLIAPLAIINALYCIWSSISCALHPCVAVAPYSSIGFFNVPYIFSCVSLELSESFPVDMRIEFNFDLHQTTNSLTCFVNDFFSVEKCTKNLNSLTIRSTVLLNINCISSSTLLFSMTEFQQFFLLIP